ncbi:MerR family transcriptional regulator [Deinococcus hohokamensis]|uniref:MerR family transcriptional regulator n=1 Tax=Deinococcus hohokamensis TaxID=309883 RepID=A0ABV9I7K8_9DEIO
MSIPPLTYYTTAELARAAGVTRRTVMHYAELQLLTPDQVTASGRSLYGPYSLRLLRDLIDLRALGLPLDEARDMVILRRATHQLDGTYRRDWRREDVPLDDARLRTLHARLRALNDAYARQAENLARFDRWLTKRFTGGDVPELDPDPGGPGADPTPGPEPERPGG